MGYKRKKYRQMYGELDDLTERLLAISYILQT